MTKFTIIPKGYRLTVKTWENDADNYRTETISGLSENDVKFFTKLCKLFEDDQLNNLYEPSDEELEYFDLKLNEFIEENKDIVPNDFIGDEIANFDDLHDTLFEMGICAEEFFTRVIESYKVEFIPEEIKILDVTDKFL
jgi:hypothetical protein